MLNESELYEMVKTAGTLEYSCGHTGKCRCSNQHVDKIDGLCYDCRCKQSEAIEAEEKKNTPSQNIVNTAKSIGSKAVQVGAIGAGAIASLSKPLPLKKLDPRY